MGAAEPRLVGRLPDIGLHIGGTAAQYQIDQVLLNIAFDEAKRTFIIGVDSVVKGDHVKLFFHRCSDLSMASQDLTYIYDCCYYFTILLEKIPVVFHLLQEFT